MREMVGGCCVCSDDRGWSENPLVYCDGQSCTVAVHQACYGIVTVPTGPWYCRKCESQERSVKVKCELCPSKYGALKRTDNSGWAHVVCALYIPEVRFGNVTTMEPIQLQLIPAERFNKVCYICEEKGRPANSTVGACMQCNKAGCRQQFHVTCAQSLGLLCEEAGNYLDNVKYCGYCQHHYSKLKKGGNVKTIPPYKPVANEAHNSDSNSEKDVDPTTSQSKTSPPSSGKKKSTVALKNPNVKTSAKSSTNSQPKSVQNNGKNSEKNKTNPNKSAKTEDTSASENNIDNGKNDKKDSEESESSNKDSAKDSKTSKKRKANSRTPTPVSAVTSETSVVAATTVSTTTVTSPAVSTIVLSAASDKKNNTTNSESSAEKTKKAKIETTQSIIYNQPVVALTSISTSKLNTSPLITTSSPVLESDRISPISEPSTPQAPTSTQAQSLLVSVPLASAALSPGDVGGNQTSVVVVPERTASTGSAERATPINAEMTGGNSNQSLLTSEMSGGGLKITYEKQVDSINTEVDMELELEPSPSTSVEVPSKRGRSQSQSNERSDRTSRSKKRSSNSNGATPSPSSNTLPKRSSRSQAQLQMQTQEDNRRSPKGEPPGAFAAVSRMKESPPSSPEEFEESQGQGTARNSRSRASRKLISAPVSGGGSSSRDSKDIKLFQNGLTAPHMLGNQLNPTSTMHSKMTDHLNSELEAHSIFNPNENNSNLVGPQMHHRVVQSARASSTGSSTASGGSGLSSMLGGGSGNIPQTLDQLLERQWEQGSQFLMEQAQHFDIASLLSCLHQLRAENLRLEEHVGSLLQRRDHLLAVNARLAIPLTGPPAAPQSSHTHTVNNIHPSVAASHGDVPRNSRHSSGSQGYPNHPQGSSGQHQPVENGLPPDTYPQNPHRSPAAGGQPSPTVRHSPASAYPGGNGNGSRPSAPRPQPFPPYDRQGPSTSSNQQHQMVIRRDRERDSEMHHHNSSKTS